MTMRRASSSRAIRLGRMSEGSLLVVYASPKKFTTANLRADQNHSFRTNRTPLARSFVAQALLPVLPIADRSVPETKLRDMNTSANRARNPRRMSSSRKNTRAGCGLLANHHLFSATAMHARPSCGTATPGCAACATPRRQHRQECLCHQKAYLCRGAWTFPLTHKPRRMRTYRKRGEGGARR
jgi:hypothetical protein